MTLIRFWALLFRFGDIFVSLGMENAQFLLRIESFVVWGRHSLTRHANSHSIRAYVPSRIVTLGIGWKSRCLLSLRKFGPGKPIEVGSSPLLILYSFEIIENGSSLNAPRQLLEFLVPSSLSLLRRGHSVSGRLLTRKLIFFWRLHTTILHDHLASFYHLITQ